MTRSTSTPECLRKVSQIADWERRTDEIELLLDDLVDQLSPRDSLILRPIDVEFRILRDELSDIHNSLFLHFRELIK